MKLCDLIIKLAFKIRQFMDLSRPLTYIKKMTAKHADILIKT